MLSANEFYAVPLSLEIVLWIEAVIYLGIGLFELFDDFMEKPRPWMNIDGKVNGYLRLTHKVGHKMHAGICIVLGFVALNGALEGVVTRFELELIFLSFAVLMPVIWSLVMPGRFGLMLVLLKPEFWLQITMFVLFSDLVRPGIIGLCVLLNVWGIAVNYLHTRKEYFQPFTYTSLRQDLVAAEGEELAQKWDKLAAHKPSEAVDAA